MHSCRQPTSCSWSKLGFLPKWKVSLKPASSSPSSSSVGSSSSHSMSVRCARISSSFWDSCKAVFYVRILLNAHPHFIIKLTSPAFYS